MYGKSSIGREHIIKNMLVIRALKYGTKADTCFHISDNVNENNMLTDHIYSIAQSCNDNYV